MLSKDDLFCLYYNELKLFFEPSENPLKIGTAKEFIKAFLRFERECFHKYKKLARLMNVDYSFDERLELANKELFKFQNLYTEIAKEKRFQGICNWILETNRYPTNINYLEPVVIYEMGLRSDLESGTDSFGIENPPYKLTEDELDIYMPVLLKIFENL